MRQNLSIHPTRYQPVIAGRDRDQELLRGLLAGTIEGNGVSVLISGEAGIGKTTLVRWLIGEADRQGLLTLAGSCFDQSTTQPYGPWNDLFSSYTPTGHLPATVPVLLQNPDTSTSISQATLFERTRAFIAAFASSQPVLLVLEDLHWSDPASLELLRYLARQIRNLPVLLALTYRDDELTREHELFTIIPHLIREAGVERLELQRLDAIAMNDLLAHFDLPPADSQRLAGYLLERTGGNPLFTNEILRSLLLDGILQNATTGATLGELNPTRVPPLLNQLIDQRLHRLDEETQQALQIAAVIGNDVPIDLWQTLLPTEPATVSGMVEQVTAARVLDESADRRGLQFVHALVRDAIYDNIPLIRRRELHRQVADVLIQQQNPDLDTVAGHLQQAGDDRALEWLVRAGIRANSSAAFMTAADRYLKAAELLEGDATRAVQRGWLIRLAGSLLRYADRQRSLELIEQAGNIARATGDEVLAAYSLYHRGIILCHRGQIGEGLPLLMRVVEELEILIEKHQLPADRNLGDLAIRSLVPDLDPDQREETPRPVAPDGGPLPVIQRGLVINWLSISGRYTDVVAMGEDWLRRIESVRAIAGNKYNQPGPAMACHLGLGNAYARLGRSDDGREQIRISRMSGESSGDYWLVVLTLNFELTKIHLPFHTDNLNERSRLLSEADRIWERLTSLSTRMTDRSPLGSLIDVLEGRWSDAIPNFEESRQWEQLNQADVGSFYLGQLARCQGFPDRAMDFIYEVLPDGPATKPGSVAFMPADATQRLAIELTLDAGDLDATMLWLDSHKHWLSWSGAVVGQAEYNVLLARFHLLQESFDTAREYADRALQLASNPRQPLAIIAAERMLGELATIDRRFEDATAHFTRSAELATRCAAPFERAQTLLPWAELCRQIGDLKSARKLTREIREICEPLEAALVLDRVDILDQQLRQAKGHHPSGLTKREVEVIQLAAGGLTNAGIGEALFISPRTVSQHLGSIYHKLGVSNRAAAVARWAELNAG